MKRLVGSIVAALVLAAVGAGIRYGIMELLQRPSFDVGDCVTVVERAIDADMQDTSCSDPLAYRVVDRIDGTDGACPFDPSGVEFVHEPDDTTYCLALGGSEPYGAPITDPDDFTGDGAPPDCIDAQIEGTEMPDHCSEYGY